MLLRIIEATRDNLRGEVYQHHHLITSILLKIQDLGWLTIKQSAQSHDPYGSDYVDS